MRPLRVSSLKSVSFENANIYPTVLRYFESRDLRDPSVAKLTTYHDIERPFAGYDALVHADRSHVYKVKYNAIQCKLGQCIHTHTAVEGNRVELIAFEAICA